MARKPRKATAVTQLDSRLRTQAFRVTNLYTVLIRHQNELNELRARLDQFEQETEKSKKRGVRLVRGGAA